MALTKKDGAIVMGMVKRGDKRHDIAAWFGENQGRIAEVEDGSMFGHVPVAEVAELPPKGAPGPKGRKLRAFVLKALAALEADEITAAKKHLQDGVAAYNKPEN